MRTANEFVVYVAILTAVAFAYFRAGRAMTSAQVAEINVKLDILQQDAETLLLRQGTGQEVVDRYLALQASGCSPVRFPHGEPVRVCK